MSNVIHLHTRRPVDPADDWSPRAGECLPCYLRRMVERGGCTGTLVWAEHWRRLRSPRACALIARLERQGATCDCAVTSVVWSLSRAVFEWSESGTLEEPAVLPGCERVRPRSTRSCELWSSMAAVNG